jgi:hypothetical protein
MNGINITSTVSEYGKAISYQIGSKRNLSLHLFLTIVSETVERVLYGGVVSPPLVEGKYGNIII